MARSERNPPPAEPDPRPAVPLPPSATPDPPSAAPDPWLAPPDRPPTEPARTWWAPAPHRRAPSRWQITLAGLLLGLLGVELAVWSVFLVPLRLFGLEGAADVFTLVTVYGAGWLGALATGRPSGAAWPGLGWVGGFLLLSQVEPGGDVLIPGRLTADPGIVTVGLLLLLAAAVAMVAVVAQTSMRTAAAGRASPRSAGGRHHRSE